MNRSSLFALLALAAIAVTALGAVATLGLRAVGPVDASLTTVLLVAFVVGSVLLGRRDAGPRTPYW